MSDLIDPSLLKGLTPEERQEAIKAAEIAKRAEERAEQRALERAMKKRQEQRQQEKIKEQQQQLQQQSQQQPKQQQQNNNGNGLLNNSNNNQSVVFVPKRKRGRQLLQEQDDKDKEVPKENNNTERKPKASKTTTTKSSSSSSQQRQHSSNNNNNKLLNNWTSRDLEAVKESYLGKKNTTTTAGAAESDKQQQKKQQRSNKKITFRFKWDDTDDTFQQDDPLYAAIPSSSSSRRRGRSNHHYNARDKEDAIFASNAANDSVYTKPLEKMTSRDWRIFRENYEIVVKGGKAPPPLRRFEELPRDLPPIHSQIIDALVNVMQFQEPTPIQRQAIPIGMMRRDLIGIAETGSGKTVAFGVPLCNYILNLSPSILKQVVEEGPLALVMAPTRELALQINDEFTKLLKKNLSNITNCCIVGGQSIQNQAYQLRRGVHIVVGTPGRINECIEMAYLVLNQCFYVVLDEADRMIDMGFQPQIESIMDSMGDGQLKSTDEKETYQQEQEDLKILLASGGGNCQLPKHRVTSMFSATMPLEVERIAKRYLRHPAVISIGDQDSGKNARIEQRIIFLSSPGQKENALRDILHKSANRYPRDGYNNNNRGGGGRGDYRQQQYREEKTIVFVNEKKHADILGRFIENRIGRPCVVLHGGKSQEQREESLAAFRRGGIIMVATDVAGRGLDIPDVSHVINYDLPTRSIENYCHRIGRTGRAGKLGLATSLITEEDTGIMAPLKQYLESTNQNIPSRLANHPAAATQVIGNLIH